MDTRPCSARTHQALCSFGFDRRGPWEPATGNSQSGRGAETQINLEQDREVACAWREPEAAGLLLWPGLEPGPRGARPGVLGTNS